ncbi:adenosylmethionine--8-amino-7-oxononanoate aminotransferase BioA [Polynucleobacter sp. SHI8]|uniref:adenosylmethionine--8-amino-7-oxononanoate transaminase n=1 Tax=unclassified Polynucleobacter TaxID=2640945 RepID=UPI002492E70B|nr:MULTISPECIES: adenosylmethionine--8-amino-7-oxononanoate transaminase [unclassified Polynucleobacter]BDW10050.1 adenosylmethionine--8-amino-7-oxononanoate aminotransferase BioA [Polynucleobacter sp. SHI2]BDW12496.1 adenosylmethionine--8-amino-7-oxononanoate aminotransferase BioA [Polynucleobacter sp. SHI8]
MISDDWAQRSLNAVWHPCTQMKSHEDFPLLAIQRGSGAYLYDHQGKSYLDSISSWWTNLFGHTNPSINQAIKNQLDQLEHAMLAGITHEPVVLLSEKLSALTSHQLGHAFYASDGASAVEIALKMSFHYWRNLGKSDKNRFICLKNSYHGETLGALSVTDIPIFTDAYSVLTRQPIIVTSPDARLAPEGVSPQDFAKSCLGELEKLLQSSHTQIAAIIIEPMVQCAAGMGMYSAYYLKGLRLLCDQYQVHLIADEIAVGCGRTGKFFACEHADIWPDLMTLSKGISGGYLPLSVVLSTDTIYAAFYGDSASQGFLHSHSYTGNPLACAAALATLKIFEDENYLVKNQALSQQLHESFAWVEDDIRIQDVRQLGTIFAFDIKPHFAPAQFSKTFYAKALEHGLLIRPIGHTVYVMPPYILTKEQIDFLSSAIQSSLNDVCPI